MEQDPRQGSGVSGSVELDPFNPSFSSRFISCVNTNRSKASVPSVNALFLLHKEVLSFTKTTDEVKAVVVQREDETP